MAAGVAVLVRRHSLARAQGLRRVVVVAVEEALQQVAPVELVEVRALVRSLRPVVRQRPRQHARRQPRSSAQPQTASQKQRITTTY